MRERVDADTEFPDIVHLLVELGRDPPCVKHEGGREPADPATDDDRFHC
jgi:hypothetical protein